MLSELQPTAMIGVGSAPRGGVQDGVGISSSGDMAKRGRKAEVRARPGCVKGCLFTMVLYAIFGVIGLVLFWALAESGPIVFGL